MTFRPPAAALASTAAGREPPVSPRMEERLEAAARRPAAALDVHTVEVGAYRVPKPAPRSATQTLELCFTRGLTIRAVLTRQQARQLAFDLLGKSAVALLLCAFVALPLAGCVTRSDRAAPGEAVWERTVYADGRPAEKTTLRLAQNEDPETGSSARVEADGAWSVDWGSSFWREIDQRINSAELVTAGAGVLCLIGAALLAGIGRHFRLAGLASLAGVLLIAIAATVERYAWAYGLGVLAAAAGAGWLAWSAYKSASQPSQNPFTAIQNLK